MSVGAEAQFSNVSETHHPHCADGKTETWRGTYSRDRKFIYPRWDSSDLGESRTGMGTSPVCFSSVF